MKRFCVTGVSNGCPLSFWEMSFRGLTLIGVCVGVVAIGRIRFQEVFAHEVCPFRSSTAFKMRSGKRTKVGGSDIENSPEDLKSETLEKVKVTFSVSGN